MIVNVACNTVFDAAISERCINCIVPDAPPMLPQDAEPDPPPIDVKYVIMLQCNMFRKMSMSKIRICYSMKKKTRCYYWRIIWATLPR